MNTIEEINSLNTDKMQGMDYCVNYITKLGKDLRTIFWLREDENGHQIFEVGYTTVLKSIDKQKK